MHQEQAAPKTKEGESQLQVYLKEEINGQEKSYIHIEVLAQRVKTQLKEKTSNQLSDWLYYYYFGTRFSHLEAYRLCSVGKIWPEFMQHPTNKQYCLEFKSIYDDFSTNLQVVDLYNQFETWFTTDTNRKMVTQKAIEALGLSVDEIKKISE